MKNQQAKAYIELEGAELQIGESVQDIECPFCQGGTSRERKFSVTRTDTGLVYNCYRSSCSDGRGFVATRGSLLPGSPQTDAKRAKWKGPYTGTFEALGDSDIEYFNRRFSLVVQPSSFVGVNSSNQFVMEVRTMDGYVRGYTVRRGCWSPGTRGISCPRAASPVGPKTKVFYHNPYDTGPSWHMGSDSARVYVVEDQVSAAKVAQAGYTGVALLGAYISEDTVKEISARKPMEVIIALDPDAKAAAFNAARKWGLAFPKTKVLVLQQDIKDMKRSEVREILR